MSNRKPISKKIRFEIFKRDDFTCQYCGRKPPAVVLEVDHIVPVSGGGKNLEHNLITACFDCNRGKGNGGLEITPINIKEREGLIKEKIVQVKAYEKVLAAEKRKKSRSIEKVSNIYTQNYEDWELTKGAKVSIGRFLERLTEFEVMDAMEMATSRMDENGCFKYFCGICWRKIKGE